jgi:hypothetical protein
VLLGDLALALGDAAVLVRLRAVLLGLTPERLRPLLELARLARRALGDGLVLVGDRVALLCGLEPAVGLRPARTGLHPRLLALSLLPRLRRHDRERDEDQQDDDEDDDQRGAHAVRPTRRTAVAAPRWAAARGAAPDVEPGTEVGDDARRVRIRRVLVTEHVTKVVPMQDVAALKTDPPEGAT